MLFKYKLDSFENIDFGSGESKCLSCLKEQCLLFIRLENVTGVHTTVQGLKLNVELR